VGKKLKRIIWIGSSRRDIGSVPDLIQNEMGYALYEIQQGTRPRQAKTLSGFGNARTLELRINDGSGTYRAVYTVQFEDIVFVLHVFHKKSNTGISTPKQELNLIRERLKQAKVIYQQIMDECL
jgi:phage-related protein